MMMVYCSLLGEDTLVIWHAVDDFDGLLETATHIFQCWCRRFGLVVTLLDSSTKLLYVEPSLYWDVWQFSGIPSQYLTNPPNHLGI